MGEYDADLHIFPDEFVPNVQASKTFQRWAKSSPGDRGRWEAFRDALLAGQEPSVPSMSTTFGRALVAAGRSHMSISHLVGQVTDPYPPAPPSGQQFGSALPARFTRPTGSIITVTTASDLTSALASVNPGQIIQAAGTLVGDFRCTRSGTASEPWLLEPIPGETLTLQAPPSTPSAGSIRVNPDVHDVMLHNFACRGAQGPSSNSIYLNGCYNVEMVGLDLHSDFHDLIEPPTTSGVMGIASSQSSHHCYGWYLHIWENGQNRTAYAPDHAWYMQGNDHWLIGSLIRDHWWGYGAHLYSVGQRRHIVNCTIINSKRAGFTAAGSVAIDDEVVNCISVDSPDMEYAYKFSAGSGHQLRNSLGWNPSTTLLTGTTVTNYTDMDPQLDAAYRPQVSLPLGETAYTPPLYRDGTVRTAATIGSEQYA